jgi:hypothetical protein
MERLGEGILRRTVIWLAASATLWFLASTAFTLFSAGPGAPAFTLLALLSFLPAFIFLPAGKGSILLDELRTVDADTGIEAFLETGEGAGAAAGLLARRALRLDADIDPGKGRLRRAFCGLLPLIGAAFLALALFESVSIALDRGPALGYRPPSAAPGSGLRTEELETIREGDNYDLTLRSQDEAEPAEAPAVTEAPGKGSPRSREEAVERAIRAEEAEGSGAEPGELGSPSAGSKLESPDADDRIPGAGPGTMMSREGPTSPRGGDSSAAGGSSPAEKGERAGGASQGRAGTTAAGKDESRKDAGLNRAGGYEGSAGPLSQSPLLDYRSRLFSALAQGGAGGDFAIGRKTDAAELREFERRFFDSFRLDSGLAPREDAYSMMLKRRWMAGGGER